MHTRYIAALIAFVTLFAAPARIGALADTVKTRNGTVQGTTEASGIRAYRGIPFAAPPAGDLRWKPPQPVKNWSGVRPADKFGAQCMQRRVFSDMVFRASGMSEDCLYLNVWTPAKSNNERLPVLVYFFGGGYTAGDGSEPRYDGEAMARKGVVALTVNYRLNVFGFFAHPELTKESPQHASGNYGLLDSWAALRWVQDNIAAFGGDPRKVTIAGESAGSISVSALMASPLSKGLIAGAIGESGAMIEPTLPPLPLAEGEKNGLTFATGIDAPSLAALRALPAEKLLEATAKQGIPRFAPTVDGYFLPKLPVEIFAAREQARVPLLAGWNSEESSSRAVLGPAEPTPENYANALKKLYNDRADQALKLYPGSTLEEVQQSATALAGDRFIAYSTWKWIELHGQGSNSVYRYFYSRPRPGARGASHSAEIEYAMGNLAGNKVFAWTPDDDKVSETMQGYFANFVKTGDPNGSGLPGWPAANRGGDVQVMHIDVNTRAGPDTTRDRYLFLDQVYLKKQ
jgi:para-nitrobenzyl esterase